MTTALGSLSNVVGYPSSSLTATGSPAVPQTTDPGLVQSAVDLSSTADVIASLGMTGTNFQAFYTAQGLLNTLSQAGEAPSTSIPVPAAGTDVQSLTQQFTDQGIVGAIPSDPAASGIYSSSGSLQSLGSPDTSSNWATLLKSNPALAGAVIADSFTQGIIGSLDTSA